MGKLWQTLTLQNVLFVPKLGRNLFSVFEADRKGARITTEGGRCYVSRGNKTLAEATTKGKLFHLSFKTVIPEQAFTCDSSESTESLKLWRERLAHVNRKSVMKAVKDVDTSDKDFVCKGCALGKQHRKTFPQGKRKRESQIGELIHADLCGPITPVSYGGAKYFLLLKDDASSYAFVYPIKTKDEVLNRLQRFVLDWKRECQMPIRRLRTDCGTEFVNEAADEWLLGKEIRHETSVPYCPQQNGLIERGNRTVVEAARSMLQGASVDTRL